jgi:flagellar basal-body rod protein FlgG
MIRGIYTAAAGMLARMNQLEVAGNNLANLDTTGYKKDQLYFRELLAGAATLTLGNGATGSEDDRTIFSQGGFVETSNRFDVALDGPGFFVVQNGARQLYTRNGHFHLNENGELVTAQGYNVLGDNGTITITGNDAKINSRGEIILNNAVSGKLRLVDFADNTQLLKMGENLFAAPPAPVTIESPAVVRQSFLETSNVDPLHVMVELIEAQHAFDTSQRVVHAEDETLRRTVNDVGRY